jgi:hypothetical protein
MEALGVIKPRTKSQASQKRSELRARGSQADEEAPEGTLAAEAAEVQWGGSSLGGLPAGADLAAQETLLRRMFKPHKVAALLAHQRDAYEASAALRRGDAARGKYGAESRLHRQLRIVAGTAANKRLLSSQGSQTRPMMEKVRALQVRLTLARAVPGGWDGPCRMSHPTWDGRWS